MGQGHIDIVHDQDLAISEARLGLDVGLTPRFGASVMLPLRVISTGIRYLDTSGVEVQLARANIHHRNETVVGLADPMLLGAASWPLGPWRLTGRAGVTIPLGRTEEDPFALGEMGLAHQHIQMGTGTVNPVLALELARPWGAWRLGAFALSQQVLYENGKGFQAGDRYAGGVAVRRRIGARWSLRGGIDVQGETAERWSGIVPTDDGNRGRFDLILGAGASWSAAERLDIDLSVKVPAVTHVVGGQLDMPAIVELGAAWSFGGSPPAPQAAHAHDHAHDDGHARAHDHDHTSSTPNAHPDTTGLDVADVGKPGEAVELMPALGKITIFDFWAAWCQPCKVLEPALVEIARAHPDIVAIRRIDTVDWDSAAVARHLTPGGFNLPHLKVFDASGRMMLEESSGTGTLEALIEKVRALVEAEAAKRSSAAESGPREPAAPPEKPAAPPAPAPRARPLPPARPASVATFQIAVTAKGFEPADVSVPAGKPVTLRFLRKVEKTCATEIVMELDGKHIVKALPPNKPVELTLTFSKSGCVGYACAMNMIRGAITAK